jgi:Na+/proline symporter
MIWMPPVAVIWSKFWRRLRIVSTAEFIEVRYGGRAAGVFRTISAIYYSFGWAVVLMAYVTGWLTKSVGPILGWRDSSIILFAAALTLAYTMLGGLLGAAYSEVFQFVFFVTANVIFGSPQQSVKMRILRGFLESDEFRLRSGQALRFQQQIVQITVATAPA